jgi:uncharacterized protein (DUF1697 family)
MARWVALLRGVNVGGVAVRGADLRRVLEGLGHHHVRTVLASGNAVFEAGPDDADPGDADTTDGAPDDRRALDLAAAIGAALEQRYGRPVPCVVLPAQRVLAVVASYPFVREDQSHQPYVVVSADPAVISSLAERARESAGHDVDRIEVAGSVVYWQAPVGSSTDTPFAKLLATAQYAPHVTTRNLRTLEKVAALLEP